MSLESQPGFASSTAEPSSLSTTIAVLLPGHRGPYAANDFRHANQYQTDEAVVEYLLRQARSSGWREDVRIELQLPAGAHDPEQERITAQAYRDLMLDRANDAARGSLFRVPKAFGLALIGICVLLLSQFVQDTDGEENLVHAAADFVQVGAWVVLWTAFSSFFFEGGKLWRRAATLRSLAKAPIRFRYEDA